MTVLLSTVFIASLLGSLHCVGMCGPFAMLASSNPNRAAKTAAIIPTVAYSVGRLITYSILGLVFGTLGLAINQGSAFNRWQQSATYLAGALMIIVGVIALSRYFGLQIKLPSMVGPLQKLLQSLFQKTLQMNPLPRAIVIGMLTSLMPCGWLYTFGITAAGTGSPLYGMLLMMVFWAGTVPIMTALMLGVSRIGRKFQQKIPLLMSLLVILLGIFTIAFRAPIDLSGMNQQISTKQKSGDLVEQIRNVDHEQLPCCQCEKTE